MGCHESVTCGPHHQLLYFTTLKGLCSIIFIVAVAPALLHPKTTPRRTFEIWPPMLLGNLLAIEMLFLLIFQVHYVLLRVLIYSYNRMIDRDINFLSD